MTLIIPYTSAQLQYHLQNNAMPRLNSTTIDKIVEQCNLVNMGHMELEDEIAPGSGVTVAQMLEDLQIDFNVIIEPDDNDSPQTHWNQPSFDIK